MLLFDSICQPLRIQHFYGRTSGKQWSDEISCRPQKQFKIRILFHNLNFPKKFRAGKAEFLSVRLGQRDYINAFASHTDDAGKTYFRIGGTIYDTDAGEGTDIFAVNRGFVAVTPLHADTADYDAIVELRKILRG